MRALAVLLLFASCSREIQRSTMIRDLTIAQRTTSIQIADQVVIEHGCGASHVIGWIVTFGVLYFADHKLGNCPTNEFFFENAATVTIPTGASGAELASRTVTPCKLAIVGETCPQVTVPQPYVDAKPLGGPWYVATVDDRSQRLLEFATNTWYERASFKQIAVVETPDAIVFVGATEIVTVQRDGVSTVSVAAPMEHLLLVRGNAMLVELESSAFRQMTFAVVNRTTGQLVKSARVRWR